jgi:hypothetical protein
MLSALLGRMHALCITFSILTIRGKAMAGEKVRNDAFLVSGIAHE